MKTIIKYLDLILIGLASVAMIIIAVVMDQPFFTLFGGACVVMIVWFMCDRYTGAEPDHIVHSTEPE